MLGQSLQPLLCSSLTPVYTPPAHCVLGEHASRRVSPPRPRLAWVWLGGLSRGAGGALKSSAGAAHDRYMPCVRGSSQAPGTHYWHGATPARRLRGRETARKFPQYWPVPPPHATSRYQPQTGG